MTTQKATHQQTKQHNRDLVLKMIFERPTTSRAEIARSTKLTPTTVSEVVAGLLAEGLVQEVGLASSIGGKPSILLSLAADSRYLIGVNLTQEKFIGALLNLRGEIKDTVEIPVQGSDGKAALALVYNMLDQLMARQLQPVVGIGVGAPGLVNTREGVVVNAVNLEWQDLPLARLLEERYHLPISVLNDSQAAAIGEFVYGEHGSEGNLVVITVRHGIGAGILINGQLFQGDGGGAGEIGHIVMQEDGLLCRCGRRGCLETIASARAVAQRLASLEHSLRTPDIGAVAQRFQSGDPLAHQAVREAGDCLGRAIGGLVGTLNIHRVVLTGDMTLFGDPWLQAVNAAMQRTALARMTQETRVEFGRLDYRASILGSTAHLLLDGYSILFTSSGN